MTPNASPRVFVALLHHPMLDRQGRQITTAVTNLDLHDISRTCRTYGVERYFVVHPEPNQRKLVSRILDHWAQAQQAVYHPKRAEALRLIEFVNTYDEVLEKIKELTQSPTVTSLMPDAREWPNTIGYGQIKEMLPQINEPVVIVFGTGWGIAPEFFSKMTYILKPLRGPSPYKHLSVRAACAIVLDRILGME